MTAPTPNIRAPTAITVRLIGLFSVFASISTRRRDPRFREAAAWQYLEPHCGDLFPQGPQVSEAVSALVLADRDPDPLGGRRHVDMIDLVFAPEALDDRIDDRGARADGPRFASSAKLIERSVPATRMVPSLISRSPALVSSASAAISRKFAPS